MTWRKIVPYWVEANFGDPILTFPLTHNPHKEGHHSGPDVHLTAHDLFVVTSWMSDQSLTASLTLH